jgi:hypothetical protein
MADHPGSLVFLLFEVLHRSHLLIQRGVRRQYVRRLQLQCERIFPIQQVAIPLSAAFFLFLFFCSRPPQQTREVRGTAVIRNPNI